MKKSRKRKTKNNLNLLNFTCFLFMISAILFAASSIGLRTYNNSLSTQKQSIQNDIAALETQNDSVQVEIRQLASADRVDQVAASSGLSYDQNSIVTISDGTAAASGE